jgi:hypothetical protein
MNPKDITGATGGGNLARNSILSDQDLPSPQNGLK